MTPPSPSNLRRFGLRALLALLVTVAASLVPASAARAGEFTYWACHTESGQLTTTDGWSATNSMAEPYATATNTCAPNNSGGLTASFRGEGNFASGSYVTWAFGAPAGERIQHVVFGRTYLVTDGGGDTSNGTTGVVLYRNGFDYEYYNVFDPPCQRFTGCVGTGGALAQDAYDVDGNGSSIGFRAGCYGDAVGHCGGSGVRASMTLAFAQIKMLDSANPTVSNVGGTATAAGNLSGTATLTFNAADQGSGVYQAAVTLDGTTVVPRSTLDTNGGKCVQTPTTGGIEFGSATPCKASLAASLNINTKLVSDGEHTLTATVYDASGNSAVVLSKKVTVSNPTATPTPAPGGACGGAPARTPGGANGGVGDLATAHFTPKKKKPTTLSVGYGSKSTVKGRLVDAHGKPIAGALVDVLDTPATAGAATCLLGTPTTDAKGRFSFKPTTTADHTIVLGYSSQVGSGTYLDQRTINVRVHANVTLKVNHSVAGLHKKVKFTGTVQAGILPIGGATVIIEVFNNGEWQPAHVPNTDARGRFSYSHAFAYKQSYKFRATVKATQGLQVHPGTSRVIRVRIR